MLIYKIFLSLLVNLFFFNYAVANSSNFKLNYGVHHGSGYFEHASESDVTALTFSGAYKLSTSDELKLALSYNEIAHDSVNTSNRGIGDTILGYKRRKVLDPKNQIIEAEAKIKLPTADDEKGLGTGEIDYNLLGTFYQRVDQTWFFITVGHKWRGDSSERNMDNGYSTKIGAAITFSPRYSSGVALEHHEAASQRSEDRKEALLYMSHKLTQTFKITFYAIKGYSEASPQWAGGCQFTQLFD